ncbi:MAG: PAS domain S-box protein [Nitrospirae bacterium]|nr:PAS domain S-box protein [Nitrospirota bacterium]
MSVENNSLNIELSKEIAEREKLEKSLQIAMLTQKEMQYKLEQIALNEKNYRQLVQLSQEGIWAIDEKNITIFVNNAMIDMLGYTYSEMIGAPLFSFMEEEEKHKAEKHVIRQRDGIGERIESRLICKDDSIIDVLVAASPTIDEKGNIIGAFAIVSDITARKNQQRLIKSYLKEIESINTALKIQLSKAEMGHERLIASYLKEIESMNVALKTQLSEAEI